MLGRMSVTSWILAGVLVGLLSPLLVLAALARAAWSELRERFRARPL
jgi:hypothetical protein